MKTMQLHNTTSRIWILNVSSLWSSVWSPTHCFLWQTQINSNPSIWQLTFGRIILNFPSNLVFDVLSICNLHHLWCWCNFHFFIFLFLFQKFNCMWNYRLRRSFNEMTVSKATQILKQIHNPTSTHGNVKLQQNNTTQWLKSI